jgi:predicted DsbA family dithiol-disulfide isomerase
VCTIDGAAHMPEIMALGRRRKSAGACIRDGRPHFRPMTQSSAIPVSSVRIDVWSDFVCPFCFIGGLRLEQLAKKQPIEVVWHAFMLRPPGAPAMTAEKRAMIAAYEPKVRQQIQEEFGLDIERGRIGAQTFAAHHAMKHAERKGRGAAFNDAVLRAYWLRGQDIGDSAVLREIGASLDLTFNDDLLAGRETESAQAVRTDIAQAAAYKIQGVPAFIFGNRYFVSGAQPLEVFERAAQAAREQPVALH